jgi:transposase
MSTKRKPYPSDVSDAEWSFVVPYLTLMRLDAPQRDHDLRAVFDALRWIVRSGAEWRMLPHDFPPWEAVDQQSQRWLRSGAFAAIVHDLRIILRLAAGRAGYDGAKRKRGSKVHLAVDTLGHLLALHVTPANAQDRAQVAMLAAAVQAETGETVTLAYVDQGYKGDRPAADAEAHGITLEVVKLPDAKHGFVLLPRRWVVERSFAWMSRFRRLARDYERLPETLVGLHLVAVTSLMLQQAFPSTDSS